MRATGYRPTRRRWPEFDGARPAHLAPRLSPTFYGGPPKALTQCPVCFLELLPLRVGHV